MSEINRQLGGEIYTWVKRLIVVQYVSGRGGRANCSIDDFSIKQSNRLLKVVDVQQAHNLNSNIRLTFKVKINYKALTKLGRKRKVVKDVKESVKIPSSPPVAL